MNYIPREDDFLRDAAEKYLPDTDMSCAICGGPIYWPDEEIDWDENKEICHAECLTGGGIMEHSIQTDVVSAELIEVKQLPIIEERLLSLKEKWERAAKDAEAMVCTEDTVQAVKAERAKLRQEFDILENQRKAAKKMVMEPYERFEAIYRECVSISYTKADERFKAKIAEVENEQKRRCEEGLRGYFAELCAFHHLDWLTYERAGIKVDMASAKAKTPKKLREQLEAFVTGVAESARNISSLDDAAEIMEEYQRSLNSAGATFTVRERHRRIEEQKAAQEARKAAQEQEAAMVHRVEALAAPVVVDAPAQEETVRVSFVMHPTMSQWEEKIKPIMEQLKQICIEEGVQYE